MTDYELVKSCAEKMGYRILKTRKKRLPLIVFRGEYGDYALSSLYNPLENMDQLYSLLVKFAPECTKVMYDYIHSSANVPEQVDRSINLKRIIAECVANL